jgi:beta-1,2-mannobiose phosphorylase / 1,2-beta-oligomannan phosphorylase
MPILVLVVVITLLPTTGLAVPGFGLVWQKYGGNPVLSVGPSGAWDSGHVILGSVVFASSMFHLWYWGSVDGFYFDIGHATSPDGIAWTKDPANPVLVRGGTGSWNERAVHSPVVRFEAGVFKMWYTGADLTDQPNSIGYATSTDGSAWTDFPGNPVIVKGPGWDSWNILTGPVLHDASGYRMWYSGSGDGLAYAAGLAMSSDGIRWTKYSGNPIILPGIGGSWDSFRVHPVSILTHVPFYTMWYVSSDGSVQRVGVASSRDGIAWTADPTPALQPGPSAWDSATLSRAYVLPIAPRFLWMWYSGSDGSHWQVGLAITMAGGGWK